MFDFTCAKSARIRRRCTFSAWPWLGPKPDFFSGASYPFVTCTRHCPMASDSPTVSLCERQVSLLGVQGS